MYGWYLKEWANWLISIRAKQYKYLVKGISMNSTLCPFLLRKAPEFLPRYKMMITILIMTINNSHLLNAYCKTDPG